MVPLAFVDHVFPGVHRHCRDYGFDLGLPLWAPRLHHKLWQGLLQGPPARTQDSSYHSDRAGLLDSIMYVFS